ESWTKSLDRISVLDGTLSSLQPPASSLQPPASSLQPSAHRPQRRGKARQDAGQDLGDVTQEQRAQRALVMLRVAAADGQNTLLVIERDHRGGADFLAGLFAEEERQLVRAQYTANRLAAGQQAADRLLGFGVTDATAYRQRRF